MPCCGVAGPGAVLARLNTNSTQTNYTFLYSTPSRWIAELNKEVSQPGQETPLLSRPNWDMLPLVGNEFPYWVGYYTSRPEFKRLFHQGSALFRAATQMHALAGSNSGTVLSNVVHVAVSGGESTPFLVGCCCSRCHRFVAVATGRAHAPVARSGPSPAP